MGDYHLNPCSYNWSYLRNGDNNEKYGILLALIALILSSLACQTLMGVGNNNVPLDAAAPPASSDGGNVTVGDPSPFPVTSDAANVASTSVSVTYQTKLSSDDVIKFYQDEFGKLGYTEDTSMAVNFGGAFTIGFDGDPSGRKIVVGGASSAGVTAVTVTLQ
jgi:hypothetical protein